MHGSRESDDPLVALENQIRARARELRLRPPAEAVFRLGHRSDPVGLPPRELCGWAHRWDDPYQEYRTLYCATSPLTCLRETLADFRPSAKVFAEMIQLYGRAAPELDLFRGLVSRAWFESNRLAAGVVWADGDLVDVDDPETRERLLRQHAALLANHGFDHLDITELRSPHRAVTQAISRSLFDDGAAGIWYRSNLDDRPCLALFEGRAGLHALNIEVGLTPAELQGLADKYHLQIRVEDAVMIQSIDRRNTGGDRRVADPGSPMETERRSGRDRRAPVA